MQKIHIANSDEPVACYILDVVISAGYHVKPGQGTRFGIWVTWRLNAFPIGSAMTKAVYVICAYFLLFL